ncbi:MAG: gamma carbonic anhydrase family protein [Deltaproteobacteria bacterium]|nr:gamma carbonic anhydrase family protein [Deltaproteobacteria bacterium]
MPILRFKQFTPVIAQDVYIADTAAVIGDVVLEQGSSVWFSAVLRGDVGPIRIGPRSNIQDCCSVHTTGGVSETILGADVTVGHGCVLHGCRIGDRVLVGMGSVILDNVVIGEESVIAAGTVLTSRVVIPPRSLVMGRPGRVVRELEPDERRLGLTGAEHYIELRDEYMKARA